MEPFDVDLNAVAAWIDRYFENVRSYPVLSRAKPGEIAAALPPGAPEDGEAFETIISDFERIIVPGITHWNSPRFFAYFATSAAPAGVAAEALAAAMDVKAMLWRTSPAATELEEVVMRWLARLMGLPPEFFGIIYDTASIGGFTALAAARESLGLNISESGMSGRHLPALRVYITEHTHSHIEKACIALGVGTRNVVRIACDAEARMLPGALREQIASDVRDGHRPMAVVATAGTTSTTAVDPVAQIAQVTRAAGVWLHVDAAYAGVAAIMPEYRWVIDGSEHADSLVVNPHKWLFVPMDCSALYVRDPDLLARAFTLVPDYLRTSEPGVRNYMDYGLQLGRRFRALKLWFVLRHLGAARIRELLRAHIRLAQEFAGWVAARPGWEVLAPHPFSVVCFRFNPGQAAEDELERLNAELMQAVNETGEMFVSQTRVGARFALRMAIGNLRTGAADVERAWAILVEQAQLIQGMGRGGGG